MAFHQVNVELLVKRLTIMAMNKVREWNTVAGQAINSILRSGTGHGSGLELGSGSVWGQGALGPAGLK